jgi:spore coat protein H
MERVYVMTTVAKASLHILPRISRNVPAACLLAGLFIAGCGRQEEPAVSPPMQVEVMSQISVREQTFQPQFRAERIESKLPVYEILMDRQDLMRMDQNPRGEELYPVSFKANGVIYNDAKIRYRGQWARTWPKKPLKIFFSDEHRFEGEKRLNLNSSFRDPSFIREPLAYHIYRAAGVPAGESKLVRVHLNGEFRGLYVQVEQPDKRFLKSKDLKGATIVKAASMMKQSDERFFDSEDEYRMHYEQETQKDHDIAPALKQFCQRLETAPDALKFFQENVDLEKYINYLAASVFCQNWDSYNKNHFLIYNADDSEKWFVLPWDLDRTLGDHWDWSFGRADLPIELGTEQAPGVTGWNRMKNKFFSHPELRKKLADRLETLLKTEFTPEKLDPILDEMHAAIKAEAALDYKRWPNPGGATWWRNERIGLDRSVATVKQYIRDRREFLLAALPQLRAE